MEVREVEENLWGMYRRGREKIDGRFADKKGKGNVGL